MRNKKQLELDKLKYQSKILEYIWYSAKANPNWDRETAKLLADMHSLDFNLVLQLGNNAKIKSKFQVMDWDVTRQLHRN